LEYFNQFIYLFKKQIRYKQAIFPSLFFSGFEIEMVINVTAIPEGLLSNSVLEYWQIM